MRRPIKVISSPAILVLKRMIPEIWVSHQPSPYRAAGSTSSAWLKMIHPKAAAIIVKSRH